MRAIFSHMCILVILSGSLWAQDNDLGPRGGKIKTSGYYRIELVECYEYMEVYVYELDMLPVHNRGLNGFVDFCYEDNSCTYSRLYSYGVDGFTAEIKQQRYTHCQVNVNGNGLSIQASFDGFLTNDPE
jgi:hypothetical protein